MCHHQDKPFRATTSLNNTTNSTEIGDSRHCNIDRNRDVTTNKNAENLFDTNKALIDNINKLMSEKQLYKRLQNVSMLQQL